MIGGRQGPNEGFEMGNGDRNVPWGAPGDSQGSGWQGNGFAPGGNQGQGQGQGPPQGQGGQGAGPGQGQWGSQGPHQGPGQNPGPGPNQGPYQGSGPGPNQGPHQGGGPQGGMTSFPLAATGAYAAVRPPEPPPVQAPPDQPPPMTSFPLAATGAYKAVGQQGNPDLSASGFRAAPGTAPDPSRFNGPPGPPGMPGVPGPPGPPPGTGNRRRTVLIGAGVVAVAGVAAGAIALTAGGGDSKKQPTPAPSPSTHSASAAGSPSSPGGQTVSGGPPPAPTSKGTPPPAAPAVADLLHWRLNEKAGSTTAADGSGKNHPGALSGAAGFSTAHGGSVEFSGAAKQIKGGQVQTKGPAIDTTKSFTVSMWVDQTGLSTPTKYTAAFSQDGPQCFAFTFSYSLDSKTWSFVRANADSANPVTVGAGSRTPTPMNTWVKLTGVYDAQAGTVALYINGLPQGDPVRTGSAPYAATGPFAVGRSWYNKYPTNPFKGYVSDVEVFSRALTADEVKTAP